MKRYAIVAERGERFVIWSGYVGEETAETLAVTASVTNGPTTLIDGEDLARLALTPTSEEAAAFHALIVNQGWTEVDLRKRMLRVVDETGQRSMFAFLRRMLIENDQ